MEIGNNIKPNIDLIDDAFQPNMVADCRLNILLTPRHFTASIFDTYNNKYVGLQKIGFSNNLQLVEILHQDLFQNKFGSVQAFTNQSTSTIVPSALYEEKNKSQYLAFVNGKEDGIEIRTDNLNSASAKVIYGVDSDINNIFFKQFENIKFNHFSTAFIESLIQRHKNEEKLNCFASIDSDSFHLVVIQGKNLLFINRFDYTKNEDILYFILFAFEQLNLNPETISLQLFGAPNGITELHNTLLNYVRNVVLGKRLHSVDFSYVFNEIEDHEHFILLNNYVCE
ncbi:MAG: DUF3822 family protein [Flavobacteriales bacterium]|nr:DUF3822 family protein [Flavobacteriales bacterium]